MSGLLIAAACTTTTSAGAQPAAFNAWLDPAFQRVEVTETAVVGFVVDSTATDFNGYEVLIRFDPGVVAFVEGNEGALMLESCGNNWFQVTATDSTVFVSHVTLCAGVSVEGPGVLSEITLEAIADGYADLTILTHPDSLFFDAGVYVNPWHPTFPRQVQLENAAIGVGNQAPLCDAGGPYSGQVGAPLGFDGTGSLDLDGSIVTYEWSFGDGETGAGATPIHTYVAADLYAVTLCVTDDEAATSCCGSSAEIMPGTAVEEATSSGNPSGYVLHQNRPNPFNPTTEIRFETRHTGQVTLSIWTVGGELVRSYRWDSLTPGNHVLHWRALNSAGEPLPSGVYVYGIEAPGHRVTRKMILIR